jgi:hypothetical protein
MELSLEAAAHIDEHRRRLHLPETYGLRIDLTEDGGSLRTTFTDGPAAGDEVVSFWGAQVFLAPALVDALLGLVLLVDEHAEPVRLVLRPYEVVHA